MHIGIKAIDSNPVFPADLPTPSTSCLESWLTSCKEQIQQYTIRMKSGRLKVDGVILQPHELATIEFLVAIGKTVKIVPTTFRRKTADIIMDGILWEMKSPQSAGKYTIEHAFQAASKQSENLLLDLRRCKIVEQKAMAKIEREASRRTKLKRVLIITKGGRLLDIK